MRPPLRSGTVLATLAVNSALQALLVLGDPTPTSDPAFLAGAFVSGALWILAYGVVVATAVTESGDSLVGRLRSRGLPFALWTLLVAAVVALGLLAPTGIVGYLVLALTVFVPIASMSGAPNPVLSGFRAIGQAPLAYIVRLAATALALVAVLAATALNAFFVGGVLSAAVNCMVLGLIGWWFTRIWAARYLASTAGLPAS